MKATSQDQHIAGHDRFLLMFAPEIWMPPEKFLKFYGSPFIQTKYARRAIKSCVDHSKKFEVLASLANRIQPTLFEDIHELKVNGFTHAARSNEFAAVIEAMICELYSVLDGLRFSIYYLFSDCRGVQKKSTSKLFSLAAENKYGDELPVIIRELLANAYNDWFPHHRVLRTTFTHEGLGDCHLNSTNGIIDYRNESLGEKHYIPDVILFINNLSNSVFGLQAGVFNYLYDRLDQIESDQVCGIYQGRMYMRKSPPEANLNSGSGTCRSGNYELRYRCPMAETCKAYNSFQVLSGFQQS